MLYWNKFQTPEYVFSKFGQENPLLPTGGGSEAEGEFGANTKANQEMPKKPFKIAIRNEQLPDQAVVVSYSHSPRNYSRLLHFNSVRTRWSGRGITQGSGPE